MGAYPLHPPSRSFLCGTADLGRDVLKSIIYGAPTSLLVGLLAAATARITGVAVSSPPFWAGPCRSPCGDQFLVGDALSLAWNQRWRTALRVRRSPDNY
jgi:hypothetical protein